MTHAADTDPRFVDARGRPRVVITGVGVVSPNGIGAEAFRDACLAGRSGLVRQTFPDHPHLKTSTVAACTSFVPEQHMDAAELRRVPRMVPMALAAAREALTMARLTIPADDLQTQRSVGVALGTGGGGLAFVEEQYRAFFLHGKGSLFSITAGTHGNLSSELSILLGLRGPSHVLSTGCTSSTDAIGYAMLLLRSGAIDRMLAGGADAPIAPGILTAFERMKVVSTRFHENPASASRPFQPDRDGFILGEGAWMFLLETAESAARRGVMPLAELMGYASTCDAFHRVQIRPDVAEPVRAIEKALADAAVGPADIDYVNLHGTGTDLNDRLETAAVKRALGPRAYGIPMSSTKSLVGHPQGACGAAGLAATVLSMRQGVLHPTINQDARDDECDLDYVPNVARPSSAKTALCNCIAFGSKNSALVVRVIGGL
ncbi:MAG: beta-ketoacyl-[acyl-carrier-protein] synthase family protein [Tepidisphaerales bacterium]